MQYIDQIPLKGQRVLARVDFNVPLDKQGKITDDSRIKAALPTLQFILQQGGKLILCSHLGKPKGQRRPELSLKPVAIRLEELLGEKVLLAPDCIGPEVEKLANDLQPGEILLLENLRFHAGETKNDPDFSEQLSRLADVYVSDAFGVVHRAHASVAGITRFVKVKAAGFLLKKEIEYLDQALAKPKQPFVLISGGAKVSTKLGILNNLLDKVDRIIIGGAMANTFLKAQGFTVGRSLVEDDLLEDAKKIMELAKAKKVGFYLPVDFILGKGLDDKQPLGIAPFQNVLEEAMILDTGPATHALFSEVLRDARTVVWNGPMGAFENPTFSQGSFGLAQSVASVQGLTIVGGGDTDALIHQCNLVDKISFISTGGGSFLEFLEGKKLPGIVSLES